jgi:catechol 2,3-dioxygenase-like lactoylglutathione lyase family enzyme
LGTLLPTALPRPLSHGFGGNRDSAQTAGSNRLSNFERSARVFGRAKGRSRNQRYGYLIPRASRTPVIFANRKNGRVALQRMDNVGIVVESLDAAISFFAELGLELEGRAMIEGDWSGRVTGLRDQRVEIAMMRTPDGHGRIELSRFLAPPVVADHRNAPVNALGYLRVMFAVDDLDDTLARLRRHGTQLVNEVVQYEDVYRLCYVRGPEGILIGLAEQIG